MTSPTSPPSTPLSSTSPSPRDWPEDAVHDPDNGSYSNRCGFCGNTFTGHKRRVVCKMCDQEKDAEACRRAAWLSDHKAPADWRIFTHDEILAVGNESQRLCTQLDSERRVRRHLQLALDNLLANRGPYLRERAREALAEARELDLKQEQQ